MGGHSSRVFKSLTNKLVILCRYYLFIANSLYLINFPTPTLQSQDTRLNFVRAEILQPRLQGSKLTKNTRCCFK